MSKAKIYGNRSGYVPNSKADMRFRKKVYCHNLDYTYKHESVVQEIHHRRELKRLERMKAQWAK